MSKVQFLAFFATVLTLALVPGSSRAAIRPYALTLSPFAGGYVFEGNQRLKASPVYGLAVGYNFGERWGGEIVASYVDGEVAARPEDNVDVYSISLDILYHFRPTRHLVPYLAAGLGGVSIHPGGGSDQDGLANYGLGLKYFLTDNIGLRADVRHVLDINVGDADRTHDVFNNLSYTAGLTFQIGGYREAPVIRDTDGDGVPDQFDRCPNTRLGVPVDGFGCPLDSDNDGVPDFLDRCPHTPLGVVVDQHGCPVDTDGDGAPDYLDKCPDTPDGTPVGRDGCPLDSDGDGVFDTADRCPGTPPETTVDAAGCPPPAPDALPAPPSLTLHLQFAYGKAAIRPEFAKELRAAADFIQGHPGARILVEGHTDSIGSVESNLALSKARAVEVRRALVENYQLDADRIEAAGFGEARPVADNATPDGRQLNRRVVITILPPR
jgi:OOP family OmpA-OmpF porin